MSIDARWIWRVVACLGVWACVRAMVAQDVPAGHRMLVIPWAGWIAIAAWVKRAGHRPGVPETPAA